MALRKILQGLCCSQASSGVSRLLTPLTPAPTGLASRWFSHLLTTPASRPTTATSGYLLSPPVPLHQQPVRTRVIVSRTKGKPRTVKAVIRRFFRLHNGLWIRPQAGRNKHKWKKTDYANKRATHHLLCTRAQCQMLDKMVNRHFKEPKYYVNDPYEPYHKLSVHPEHKFVPRKFYP